MTYEQRTLRLPIFVNPLTPGHCNQDHARYRIDGPHDPQGCPSLNYDDNGEAFCGAFGRALVAVEVDASDPETPYVRCPECLIAEIK